MSDNISYVRPINSFERAEPYLKYLEHLNLPKFGIKKEFADSNDVCLLYELPHWHAVSNPSYLRGFMSVMMGK